MAHPLRPLRPMRLNRLIRPIRPLTQSSHLASGAILLHALPGDVAQQWQVGLQTGAQLPDVAGQGHPAFPLSQVGGQRERKKPLAGIWAKLKRAAQKVVSSVVLVSLQIGVISPLGHALAQNQTQQTNWAMHVPNTGYAPNGELYINAQRIGLSQDPFHQQQHNNQVPGLFFIDAVQFSKPVSDPSYAHGNLAQMENHTVNLHLPAFDVLFTRLYLTLENPYPSSAVTPPNYTTYRDSLTAAQGANYTPVVAGPDNTTFAFKTLTSPNAAMRNMLVTEIPTHPDFQAALERPNGTPAGAVGVRVGLNGEMATLQDYVKNTKPYDFSYQSAMGPYANGTQRATYNPNGALDIDPMKDTASFFMNWTLGSTDVQNQLAQAQKNGMSVGQAMGGLVYDNVTGRYYIPTGAEQEGQTNIFDANFLAMAAPQQTTVTGGRNDGAVITGESGLPEWGQLNQAQKESQAWHQEQQTIAKTQAAQTSANSIDFSQFASTNALFGQGYDLYRYNAKQNPNGEAENALMRRLMNGELAPGTPEYEQAEKIAQQRYREQYAYHQITGAKLTFNVADGQAKANSLNLNDVNPNELFGDGFDLFQYTQNEEEKNLLRRLQAGQLVVGSEEYERAAAVARQSYRNAYTDHIVNGKKKSHTDGSASYQANKLDLSDTSVTELFGSGFDLYRWAHTEENKSLLRRLQSGELRPGTDEYKVALSLAQQYYRNAYAEMLNPPPPPPPKKVPKWKKIVAVVAAAILTVVTAGAAAPYILSAIGGMSVTAAGAIIAGGFISGTALGVTVGAIAGVVGSAVGTFVSTAITTGNIGTALQAAGSAIVSGSIKAIVTNVVAGALGLSGITGGLESAIGSTATGVIVNSLTSAAAQTAVNGGSFGDNLATAVVNSVVDVVAETAAGVIGVALPNTDGTNLLNYAAHGVLGCATAAAKGQSCEAGAVGAVVGEAAAATGTISNMAAGIGVTLTSSETSFYAGVVGGAAAAVVGSSDDVNSNFAAGQATGENAAENNNQGLLLFLRGGAGGLRACAASPACARLLNNTVAAAALGLGAKSINDLIRDRAIDIQAQNMALTYDEAYEIAATTVQANYNAGTLGSTASNQQTGQSSNSSTGGSPTLPADTYGSPPGGPGCDPSKSNCLSFDDPTKVVNTNIEHTTDRVMERANGVDGLTRSQIRNELQELSANIEKNGWPRGSINDTNPNSVLVPYREGYVVYRINAAGRAVIRTFLNAK